MTNYSGGDLAQVFSCMAQLGINGCGFEQPLESMRLALDPNTAANSGFIRPDAFLAIIIISDEDDCSTYDPEMFDKTVTGIDSKLGPLDSFRCFEFGVQCDPDDIRSEGEKFDCVPREDSPYMSGVQEYVDFVKGLKVNPDKIIVAGIIGVDPDENGEEANPQVTLETRDINGNQAQFYRLEPACETGAGKAAPAVRLNAFLNQFTNNSSTTICDENLSDALNRTADLLTAVIGNPNCLTTDVFIRDASDTQLPYDCQASYLLGEEESALPHCDVNSEDAKNQPCWYIAQDRQEECADAGEPFQELFVIDNQDRDPNTQVVLQCAIESDFELEE